MYCIPFVYIMGCFQTWCTPTSHNIERKYIRVFSNRWLLRKNKKELLNMTSRSYQGDIFPSLNQHSTFIDSSQWWILLGNERETNLTRCFSILYLCENLWKNGMTAVSKISFLAHWIEAGRDMTRSQDHLGFTVVTFWGYKCLQHTVDARKPAPPGMSKEQKKL